MVTEAVQWSRVHCRDCQRTYWCTPDDDYYGWSGELDQDGTHLGGQCERCLIRGAGMVPIDPVALNDHISLIGKRP